MKVNVMCIRCMDQYKIIFDHWPRVGEEEVASTEIDVEKFIKYIKEKGYEI